ncbi:hypothetical protein BZA77DRAFT_8964 [Pyronema omphalodes]|nr:hypothetical protein BZA77DRAFT_8964 [Pyronema omphalodes]
MGFNNMSIFSALLLILSISVSATPISHYHALRSTPSRSSPSSYNPYSTSKQSFLLPPRNIAVFDPSELTSAISDLNTFFASEKLKLGQSCVPEREEDEFSSVNRVCIGNTVAFCDPESWAWEELEECNAACGAGSEKARNNDAMDIYRIGVGCRSEDTLKAESSQSETARLQRLETATNQVPTTCA